MNLAIQNNRLPIVVRYTQSVRTGVENQKYSRYAIGYVIQGKKYVYSGDARYEINHGDVFCLDIGNHYIENVPEGGRPCEQIIFYLTSDMLIQTMSMLHKDYGMNIQSGKDSNAGAPGVISTQAWESLKIFFSITSQYDKIGYFSEDEVAERIAVTELLHMLLAQKENVIRDYLLNKTHLMSESFERIIHSSIFENISIDALAEKCHMSPTSFKKEFRRIFNESPHRWFIRQRLMRSRHLLISTNKSIVEIGEECGFSNTSHYIKLFKGEYGITPAVYRQMSRQRNPALVDVAE